MARRKDKTLELVEPTPEQLSRGAFEVQDTHDKLHGGTQITIGKAYRRRPMIDILLATEVLDHEQHKALKHYRHHADIADRSPVRDSLCLQRGGSGDGPTITTLNAVAVVRDCERAAGSLLDILRAVVVYDRSLSQVAIDRAGAVEKVYQRKGKNVFEIRAKESALKAVKQEIRIAAFRVMSELDA